MRGRFGWSERREVPLEGDKHAPTYISGHASGCSPCPSMPPVS